jgi:hypothetical protein
VSGPTIRPWVVEVRCPDRSFRPELLALWRDLDHLPRELFDTTHEVGLRVDVLAADATEASAHVQRRVASLHGNRWVNGVDYTLKVSPPPDYA